MTAEPAVSSSHVEHLLAEIESSDGLLGPTLRAVYDGEQHGEFMDKLEERIRVHDKDIERMCNYHYQGFIESVNELLKVRGEARKLKLASKCENLIQCRTTQRNIVSAIETLSVCLPVLEMYAKLKDQMKNRRFRFAEIMQESIPAIQKNNLTLVSGISLKKKGEDEELDKSPQDLVDFSPVYKCLYIFTGERETFEIYYRKQRRKQARLALELSHGTRDGNLESYKAYFHQIVGFFVVEDIILHTTKELVTRSTVDDLWEMAAAKIAPVLLTCTQSAYCEDPSLLIKIKELIVWFCHTLSGFGFNVKKIFDVLLEMRHQYNEILSKDWEAIFKNIFDEDNYTPILCEDESQYSTILKEFPFEDSELQGSFPRHLPFSEGMIKVYKESNRDWRFSTEVNKFASNPNAECLHHLAHQETGGFNSSAACVHLEEYVSGTTGTSSEITNVSRVYGLSTFKRITTGLLTARGYMPATTFLNFSTLPVKQMNASGLKAFNQDLRKCEGINEGILQMTFLELRQLIDLLLNEDWSTYFADHGSTSSKYSRVNPYVVAKLLEKMKDPGKKRMITLKKSERDRKKLNESILKKLKTLDAEVAGASIVS
ncbi:Exocyst complex component 6 [Acropora cervicornis]|uniref:Exocyst complex component 6 n=1 Tax=Acropora cervicornis TaxID=6130 RepID=A0AAD9VG77_ACRCE|nr:Exocyst complex component 6 [Acropora cervicornis]